jgi:hypothetical protein
MNLNYTKRFGSLIIVFCMISSVTFAQFDNVDFLRSAPADGVKFVQAYISPWANAFGAGLNGGWYNTAKPHKFGGFDITAGVNVGMVPSSAETFEISSLGLSTSLSGTGPTSTVAGPNTTGPLMTYSAGGVTLGTFNTPPGAGLKYIPVPTAQIGVGLPLGTELKFRFFPKVNIKGGDISLWGVGVMHSIMQYIPGNKLLPVDVSVFAGYTKLTSNVPLSLQPQVGYTNTISASIPLDNQNIETIVDALNISAIASLSIPVLTIYGGIGYSKTNTTMKLTGNFPTPVLVATPAPAHAEYNDSGIKKGTDFPEIGIKNFSGLRANAGIRIKLAVVTIHFDYTRAQYNVLSTGLGISFR